MSFLKEFDESELEGKLMAEAVGKAEHRNMVRLQLFRKWNGGRDGEKDKQHRSSKYQQYGKILGLLGYDQLQLKPLARVDMGDRRTVTDSMAQKDVVRKDQNVTALLKKIIGEIELVGWLNPDEREHLVNTFISDLAYRYNKIQDLMKPSFTPHQNRMLAIKIFERIGMDQLGVFSADANSSRVISMFRTELNKRINTVEMLRQISAEIEGGAEATDNIGYTRQDLMALEVQEFKDALESVIHPLPTLEAPKITTRSHHAAMRRRRIIEDVSGKTLHHLRLTVGARPGSQPGDAGDTERHGGPRQHELIEQDLSNIMARNALQSEKVVAFQEDSGSGSDFDEGIGGVREPRGERLEGGEGYLEKDNPVLQAHTISSVFVRRKDPVEIPHRDRVRYLPRNALRDAHLPDFDYNIFDIERAEPLRKIATKSDENPGIGPAGSQDMRSMASRVSLRVPKGFITLSAEPASAVSEFGSEVDSKLLNSLDEKLTSFKEVEELYEEIMKTVNGSHLETDEDIMEGLGCPAAPYDPKIPLSASFQGIIIPTFSRPTTTDEEETAELLAQQAAAAAATGRFTPSIRLNTRGHSAGAASVTADDFTLDRQAAMRRTISSRYNVLRYNYGGYIPYDIDRKQKKRREVFCTEDYVGYLRTRTCDFVMDLL
ncbi:hypothetical protein HK101_004285, partial [Irineochytrium annulatum]